MLPLSIFGEAHFFQPQIFRLFDFWILVDILHVILHIMKTPQLKSQGCFFARFFWKSNKV